MARSNNEISKVKRYYPTCCTSAYCGGCGDDCIGCRYEPELKAFNAWVEKYNAIRPDPIWSPTLYVGGA